MSKLVLDRRPSGKNTWMNIHRHMYTHVILTILLLLRTHTDRETDTYTLKEGHSYHTHNQRDIHTHTHTYTLTYTHTYRHSHTHTHIDMQPIILHSCLSLVSLTWLCGFHTKASDLIATSGDNFPCVSQSERRVSGEIE